MTKSLIEKQWITDKNYLATITIDSSGTRCGYISVPIDHPAHGLGCNTYDIALDDITEGIHLVVPVMQAINNIEVHGGLTYGNTKFGQWTFGFDCAHAWDYPDTIKAVKLFGSEHKPYHSDILSDQVIRSKSFCVTECIKLSTQLYAIECDHSTEFINPF